MNKLQNDGEVCLQMLSDDFILFKENGIIRAVKRCDYGEITFHIINGKVDRVTTKETNKI